MNSTEILQEIQLTHQEQKTCGKRLGRTPRENYFTRFTIKLHIPMFQVLGWGLFFNIGQIN